MRAILIPKHGGPEVLQYAEIADPKPGPNEVLVRVHACALNHLDLWVRQGLNGVTFPLPLVPGSDIAGEVAAVGGLVTRVQPRRQSRARSRSLLRPMRGLRGRKRQRVPQIHSRRLWPQWRLRRIRRRSRGKRAAHAGGPLL